MLLRTINTSSSPVCSSLSELFNPVIHSSMLALYVSVMPDTQHERLKFFTAIKKAMQQISTDFTRLSQSLKISSN